MVQSSMFLSVCLRLRQARIWKKVSYGSSIQIRSEKSRLGRKVPRRDANKDNRHYAWFCSLFKHTWFCSVKVRAEIKWQQMEIALSFHLNLAQTLSISWWLPLLLQSVSWSPWQDCNVFYMDLNQGCPTGGLWGTRGPQGVSWQPPGSYSAVAVPPLLQLQQQMESPGSPSFFQLLFPALTSWAGHNIPAQPAMPGKPAAKGGGWGTCMK